LAQGTNDLNGEEGDDGHLADADQDDEASQPNNGSKQNLRTEGIVLQTEVIAVESVKIGQYISDL
jgi:hypothetical protein